MDIPAVMSVPTAFLVFFEDTVLLGVGMLAAVAAWRSWTLLPEKLVSLDPPVWDLLHLSSSTPTEKVDPFPLHFLHFQWQIESRMSFEHGERTHPQNTSTEWQGSLLAQLCLNTSCPFNVLNKMDLLKLSINKLSKGHIWLLWPHFMKVPDWSNTLDRWINDPCLTMLSGFALSSDIQCEDGFKCGDTIWTFVMGPKAWEDVGLMSGHVVLGVCIKIPFWVMSTFEIAKDFFSYLSQCLIL